MAYCIPLRAGTDDLTSELQQLRDEHDLYRHLLSVGGQADLSGFVRDALRLIVEATGAQHGYLEIRNAEGSPVRWSAADLDDTALEAARATVSRGMVAKAVLRGEAILTASARLDERFQAFESVQAGALESALCVPIGQDPPLGVVYLEGRQEAGPFSERDRDRALTLAGHLAPFVAQRLESLAVSRQDADPTAEARTKLKADEVVGHSHALADVLHDAALLASVEANVLITGESGTGKSQIARVIHESGARAGRPFVQLNCAALPTELFENELFGSVAGAHSTAPRDRKGKIAEAEGGSLLLDEIGELDQGSQAKLLQFLQSRDYYPLGSSQPLRADVRVMAATNADLESAVASGCFREDLFYRLRVVPIRVPALSERPEDLVELARAALLRVCSKIEIPGLGLSLQAESAIEAAEWPGNVRQLENAIEAAAIRAHGEAMDVVGARHLFPDVDKSPKNSGLELQRAVSAFKAAHIRRALDECEWNVSETARRLDIARSALYRSIKTYGLERNESQTGS